VRCKELNKGISILMFLLLQIMSNATDSRQTLYRMDIGFIDRDIGRAVFSSFVVVLHNCENTCVVI